MINIHTICITILLFSLFIFFYNYITKNKYVEPFRNGRRGGRGRRSGRRGRRSGRRGRGRGRGRRYYDYRRGLGGYPSYYGYDDGYYYDVPYYGDYWYEPVTYTGMPGSPCIRARDCISNTCYNPVPGDIGYCL